MESRERRKALPMNITAIRLPGRERTQTVEQMDSRTKTSWTASDLQRAYLDDVYRYDSRRISCREEAEDLTIDVFGSAFRSLHKYRGEAEAKTWLPIAERPELFDIPLPCFSPSFPRKKARGHVPDPPFPWQRAFADGAAAL